jgi:DNA-binding CsgD family transcriptional regulator
MTPLTPREHEVLAARCRLDSDKAVAAALGVSLQTVKNHLQAIRDKTNTKSTLRAAVVLAREGALTWDDVA